MFDSKFWGNVIHSIPAGDWEIPQEVLDKIGNRVASELTKKYSVEPPLTYGSEENRNTPGSAPVATEKMVIDSIVHIPTGAEKTFTAKEITFTADIHCEGKLVFDRCVLSYNSANVAGQIILESSASSLEISRCTIIDMNVDTEIITKKPLIISKDSSAKTFICNNSLFNNCKYLLSGDISVRISDSIIRYSSLVLNNRNFIRADVAFEVTNCLFENLGKTATDIKLEELSDVVAMRLHMNKVDGYLLRGEGTIAGCTFKNIVKCAKTTNIVSTMFICCSAVIGGARNIKDCLFDNCQNIMSVGRGVITHCQFTECKDMLVTSGGAVTMTYCEFYNINTKGVGLSMTCGKGETPHKIQYCTFDGIHTKQLYHYHPFLLPIGIPVISNGGAHYFLHDDGAFIASRASEDGWYRLILEDCRFHHCVAEAPTKIVNTQSPYYGVFGKKKMTQTVCIRNCTGLEKVNQEGDRADKVDIHTETSAGVPIGAQLDEAAVGVPGFTPKGKLADEWWKFLSPSEKTELLAALDNVANLTVGDIEEGLSDDEDEISATSVADYTARIRHDPANAQLFFERGKLLLAEEKHDEALADFEEAFRLDPDNEDMISGLLALNSPDFVVKKK